MVLQSPSMWEGGGKFLERGDTLIPFWLLLWGNERPGAWSLQPFVAFTDTLKWKWKSLSHVWLFAIPWIYSPWNCLGQNTGVGSLSLLQGTFPNPGIKPKSPNLQAVSLPAETQGKSKDTRVGSQSLLHWIFPTREFNWGLLHCRWIFYQLSYQGSPGHCVPWVMSVSQNQQAVSQIRFEMPTVLASLQFLAQGI